MMESLVKGPSIISPCNLPPPYDPQVLGALIRRKTNTLKIAEKWERNLFNSLDNGTKI